MSNSLLEQFLVHECTSYVRGLLEDALADTSAARSHFEFNRFEVTIERDHDMVLLEDVLDATEAGTQRVPLAQFVQDLQRWCSA
jgi:hypothetical protein